MMDTKRLNPEVLPQAPFDLVGNLVRLAPPETSTKEHIDRTLDYLEAKMADWSREQDRRLRKAEKRISICGFLRGLLSLNGHFSWCPFEAWMQCGLTSLTVEDVLNGGDHSH